MTDYNNFSDEELIKKYRIGDYEISNFLLEKYKYLVKKKARAMFLIGGETDDLVQEGMIGLFKAIQDFKEDKEASFQTFAKMCIDRQIYSAVSMSNRQKHSPLNSYVSLSQEEGELQLEESPEHNPEFMMIDQENEENLKKIIKKNLSPMENKVLSYYLDGVSYVKIAELMGKTPKSIDNALQRIRGKIRQIIE